MSMKQNHAVFESMSIFQKHVLSWSSQTLGWSIAQESKDQTLTDLSFPWTLRTQPSEHTAQQSSAQLGSSSSS